MKLWYKGLGQSNNSYYSLAVANLSFGSMYSSFMTPHTFKDVTGILAMLQMQILVSKWPKEWAI